MPLSNQQKNQHLMWRAGFGPAAEQLEQLTALRPAELYGALRAASQKQPAYIDVADDFLKGLMMGADEARKNAEDPEQKRMVREKSRDSIKSLNLTWLGQMHDSPQQLREKMALFWHGHFASRNLNIFFQQQLLDVLRRNALGSFRTLLHEVSKSAAMLNFLNAQQNKKDHPNENFAREVMELFTLGRGNYSENDIKEAARAFTGWGANIKGDFQFRKFFHDAGQKTVLGKTGMLEGEDVLDILLEQKQTARYITAKLYRFLVNENAPDTKRVEWLADRFYKNDYDIQKLLDDIFTSDWFYDPKNVGANIKSPVVLLAGMQRILPMEIKNEEALLLAQRLLGQMLFYPPNVAGWPGGRSWIDSSTLMFRMRIPMLLNDQDELNIRPKTDDDTAGGKMEAAFRNKGGGQRIDAKIDWQPYLKYFETIPREQLLDGVARALLQVPLQVPPATVSRFADSSGRENFVRTATLQVMSTPEYQLC